MGAWIETRFEQLQCYYILSHPSWVRGLKQEYSTDRLPFPAVAPFMGAWIETQNHKQKKDRSKSHPSWVRGLKHEATNYAAGGFKSHPSWVRGLKLMYQMYLHLHTGVAPFMGAWIETIFVSILPFTFSCRTLHGCVD